MLGLFRNIIHFSNQISFLFSNLSCSASVNSRKDKSLRVMSQKFVMLFLVSSSRVVSLDVAAKILIGEDQGADQDKNKFKSEYRACRIQYVSQCASEIIPVCDVFFLLLNSPLQTISFSFSLSKCHVFPQIMM